MIEGTGIKHLVRHVDERGFFMELARITSDPFFANPGVAQISTPVRLGGIVAWHVHPTQVDWWWVARGDLQVVLLDRREASPTYNEVNVYLMGEHYGQNLMLKIPPGVAHGFRVRSGPAQLIYLTSRTYDPAEEHRLDPRDPELSRLFDWFAPDPIR